MDRAATEHMRQFEREKLLYKYSSALERADFAAVADVLSRAEQDPALEHLILEINAVYEVEMERLLEPSNQGMDTLQVRNRDGVLARLLGWARRGRRENHAARPTRSNLVDQRPTYRRTGSRLGNTLIAAGAVMGTVLAFAVGWVVYSGSRPVDQSLYAKQRQVYLQSSGPVSDTSEQSESTYVRLYGLSSHAEALTAPTPRPPSPGPDSAPQQTLDHLIVREGRISLLVRDTRAAKQAIEEMIAALAGEGAYVVSIEEERGLNDGSPMIDMVVRVPVGRFGETMDQLEKLAVQVIASNESGQDVTEKYVDLQARLESLEAARQRLLEIMQEATDTEALLKTESQLTEREADIESLKGQMQYLEGSARLSSIQIGLQPHILSEPVGVRWRPAESTRRAVETLIDHARGLSDFLIFFAIAVLPWIAGVGLVLYGVVHLVLWRVRASRGRRASGV